MLGYPPCQYVVLVSYQHWLRPTTCAVDQCGSMKQCFGVVGVRYTVTVGCALS